MIYTSIDQILKVYKDIDIDINRKEIKEHYYLIYFQTKSIKIISYQHLNFLVRPFTKIAIDIIEYKPLS